MSANVVSPENLEKTSASIYNDILSLSSKMDDTITRLTALSNTAATKSEVNSMVKNVNLNGRTLTVTKGDGSSSTFTTVDNNTTYNLATQTASGLQSAADKKRFDSLHIETMLLSGSGYPNRLSDRPVTWTFKQPFKTPPSVLFFVQAYGSAGAYTYYNTGELNGYSIHDVTNTALILKNARGADGSSMINSGYISAPAHRISLIACELDSY